MINLPTKFEVSTFSRYGDMKCIKNPQMGWFGVVRGHPRSTAISSFDRAHMTSYSTLIETASILYRFRDTASYLLKFANFDLPHLHLAPPLGVTRSEFRKKFWRQKTRVPGLSCGVVCVFLHLAVLVELRRVTDTHTNRQTHTDTGLGIYRAVKTNELLKTNFTVLRYTCRFSCALKFIKRT